MEIYSVKTASILPLGKQGENLARKIQFDISRWISTFGPGTVQLLHQRSGDEAPYPVAVEREGNLAVWTVTNADTAAPGTGHTELQYYVGDALAKSETWMTKVLASLGDASETPPEAQQGWVDQVLQAGAEAAEAAERAENAYKEISEFARYTIGDGLKLDEATNTLSVDTAEAVEQDNTKPVTSAAVYVEIGNIEALLAAL